MLSSRPITPIDPDESLRYDYGDTGAFFLYCKTDGIFAGPYGCRDEFSMNWDGIDADGNPDGYEVHSSHRLVGFTFGSHGAIDLKALNRRWTRIERMVGAAPSLIYPTSNERTVIIRLSPFWVANATRRCVFTLLLRMVLAYWKTGLGQAIDSYCHARDTKAALRHFLRGHTVPTFSRWNEAYNAYWENHADGDEQPEDLTDLNGYVGWVGEFKDAPLADIRRKLVKP